MKRGPVVLGAQGSQAEEHDERGIPRYVGEHVRALCKVAPDLVSRIDLDPSRRRPPWIGSWQTAVPIADQTRPPDDARLYHVMSPFEYLPLDRILPRWAQTPRTSIVVTLYDLIPLLFPSFYLADPALRHAYRARLDLVRAADAVLAISESTADDAVTHLGIDRARLHVIHAGCSPFFAPASVATAALFVSIQRAYPRLQPGFLFCSGGIDPRKNLDGLIAGYARLPADDRAAHQLVIACRTTPADEARLAALAGSLGVGDQVIVTGYVTDEMLRTLYQACTLFVFPSLYEGFGLPVIEAMRCGAPVFASDIAPLRPIVENADARFDPADPSAMAATLHRGVHETGFADSLRDDARRKAAEYTWERVAERTADAYRRVLDARPPIARRLVHRPRWAIFAPMPPQPTAIAGEIAAVAEALASDCEVDLFVEGDPADYVRPAPRFVSLADARTFRHRNAVRGYDVVLHCLGSSQGHVQAWAALMQSGGDVLLHDVKLTGLYTALRAAGTLTATTLDDEVRRQYGTHVAPELQRALSDLHSLSTSDAERFGACMASAVLRRAGRTIVTTDAARQMAVLEPPDARERVHVVPFDTRHAGAASDAAGSAVQAADTLRQLLEPPEDRPDRA